MRDNVAIIDDLMAKTNSLERENADLKQKLNNSIPLEQCSQIRIYHRLAKFIVEQNQALNDAQSGRGDYIERKNLLNQIFDKFEKDIHRMFINKD